MTLSTAIVQTTPESLPSTPGWMGEVAAFAQILSQTGILAAITERVRFARARMGTYELIDFVVVLIGYALSGEPTLRAFYERLLPFADEFMALFERSRFPSRSALSRFLAALDQASVESLRTLFQKDLLVRAPFADPGGIRDRCEQSWLVADVDGTRKVARQRALPRHESLPAPHRRFDHVCAKGYQGRKRGEVARTRTVVLQAHTHQFLGTFGDAGNGDYRGELLRAIQVLIGYGKQVEIEPARILTRLDGLYGNAAPLTDVLTSGLGLLARSKDYQLLDLAQVQAVLAGPPATTCTHPESQTTRTLFDCLSVPLSPVGPLVRLIVATSPATSASPSVGEQRAETVYELFVSTVPSPASALKMCWICICIVAPLRPCWLMKTLSKMPTVGCLIPPADSNAFKSWRNGCGTCVWNLVSTWLQRLYVPPNLLRLTPFRQHPPASRLLRWSTALHYGQGARLQAVFLDRLFPCNPMERCAAPLIVPSTRKNADRSAMAPCASCMLGALATVAPARCANSVKNTPRPKNRDGSAPYFGPFPLILSRLLLCLLPLPLCLRLLPCAGVIGRVAISADAGFPSSAAKPRPFPGNLPASANSPTRTAKPCSLVSSAPTTDSPGHSVWLAMRVPLMIPGCVSSYMAFPLASSRPLALLVRQWRKPLFSHTLPLPFLAGWRSLLHRKISLYCSCSSLFLVEIFKPPPSPRLPRCASRGPGIPREGQADARRWPSVLIGLARPAYWHGDQANAEKTGHRDHAADDSWSALAS